MKRLMLDTRSNFFSFTSLTPTAPNATVEEKKREGKGGRGKRESAERIQYEKRSFDSPVSLVYRVVMFWEGGGGRGEEKKGKEGD